MTKAWITRPEGPADIATIPRFGFTPASGHGIRAPFDVPDENMMALAFDPAYAIPAGTIRYAKPFGV
jgi:predicted N-acetyltransferase YhbS